MPAIAALLLVAWWRQWLPRRAWWIAVALQAALVASSVVALRTGEADEERVERVVASEASIERHEEAAELFLWASVGVLALLGAAAVVRRDTGARAVAALAVVGTLAIAGLGYRVGHAGGELVYRDGAARAYASAGANAPAVASHGDHDEDDDD